jgi:hypothetical protein
MTTRTSTETVTFQHPFRLSRIDEVQPAGHYSIETKEELLEALSFPAYRRHVTSVAGTGATDGNAPFPAVATLQS